MAVMAENCMTHLEMLKEKEDLRRSKIMNMSLAAFVDPENRVHRKHRRKARTGSMTGSAPQSTISERGPGSVTEDTGNEAKEEGSIDRLTHRSSGRDPEVKGSKDDPTRLLKDAAPLLLNSLSLDPDGGVLFLDAGTSLKDLARTESWSDASSDEEIGRAHV